MESSHLPITAVSEGIELPEGWVLDVFCTWTAWAHNKEETLGVREDAASKEEALNGLKKRMDYLKPTRFVR